MAKLDELRAHLLDRGAVVLAEVENGLVIRWWSTLALSLQPLPSSAFCFSHLLSSACEWRSTAARWASIAAARLSLHSGLAPSPRLARAERASFPCSLLPCGGPL